jgi:ribonuclease-3
MKNQYLDLEKKIAISFKNKSLLENVFIHRSYLNEHRDLKLTSNERLEFLGDSVLSLITSVYLFKNYPYLKEGEYTDIKGTIVCAESLSSAAKKLELGKYIFLSKGEEKNQGRKNKNILADCFEALIAAIFLEKDFETAYQFVVKFLFAEELDFIIKNRLYLPAKTQLQEWLQEKYKALPEYRVIEEKGPAHKKFFKVGVYFKEKLLGVGTGFSKKEAEEKAAKIAIEKLKKEVKI